MAGAQNTNLTLDLDDSYGLKLDYLVEGFTKCVQQLLKQRSIQWSNLSRRNFFRHHPPNNPWTSDELKRINTCEIEKWDMSLCAKWLLDFRWGPYLQPLNPLEENAVKELRTVRNDSKHTACRSDITQAEFENKCQIVGAALSTLRADERKILEILERSRNRVSADRSDIFEIVQHWKFTTKQILGSGSYGIVLAAEDRFDRQTYAIKLIPNQENGTTNNQNEHSFREAQSLAILEHHPNVVKYKTTEPFLLSTEKFKEIVNWNKTKDTMGLESRKFLRALFNAADDSDNKIVGFYIKTELCGESLRQWLDIQAENTNQLDLHASLQYGRHIVKGLNYIHSHKIVHRDLRPNNIFFSKRDFKQHLKIGDFGLSNQIEMYKCQTLTKDAGSNLYQAPEINRDYKDGRAKYGQAVDLYSLGLVFSELFHPAPFLQLRDKFGNITFKRNTGPKIQGKIPKLDAFILKLTQEDPNQRYTLEASGKPRSIAIPLEDSDVQNIIEMDEVTFAKNGIESGIEELRIDSTYVSNVATNRNGANFNFLPQYNLSSRDAVTTIQPNFQPIAPPTNVSSNLSSFFLLSQQGILKPEPVFLDVASTNNALPNVLTPTNTSPRILTSNPSTPVSPTISSQAIENLSPAERLSNTQTTDVSETDVGQIRNSASPSPTLKDEDIVTVRKLLLKNKTFWTQQNVAKFFSELDGTDIASNLPEFVTMNSSSFNKRMYGIRNKTPHIATEKNIIEALNATGFSELADSLKTKWRIS